MKKNKHTSNTSGAKKLQLSKDRPSPGTATVAVEFHKGKTRPVSGSKSR